MPSFNKLTLTLLAASAIALAAPTAQVQDGLARRDADLAHELARRGGDGNGGGNPESLRAAEKKEGEAKERVGQDKSTLRKEKGRLEHCETDEGKNSPECNHDKSAIHREKEKLGGADHAVVSDADQVKADKTARTKTRRDLYFDLEARGGNENGGGNPEPLRAAEKKEGDAKQRAGQDKSTLRKDKGRLEHCETDEGKNSPECNHDKSAVHREKEKLGGADHAVINDADKVKADKASKTRRSLEDLD